MGEEVKSEAKFFWELLKFILLLPITIIMILFKKKEASELFTPIKEAWTFFWEAKVTAFLIVLNMLIYATVIALILTGVLQGEVIEKYFITYPCGIFRLDIIPFFGSMFFHAGLAHLFGNMLALFILGRVVEKHFGAGKTFMLYIGAGMISSLADSAIRSMMNDTVGALGASGAIAGMASAAMLISPFTLTFLILGIPIPIFAVAWMFVATDILGILNQMPGDNVGHIAHLGGFFAIMITAFFLSSEDKQKLLKGLLINLAIAIVLGLVWFFVLRG